MIKESNTAKGVNIDLNSKTLDLTKKLVRHKMRRIQGKKLKMETYKIHKT